MGKYSLLAGRIPKTKRKVSDNSWGAPVGPPIKIGYWYVEKDKTNKIPPKK